MKKTVVLIIGFLFSFSSLIFAQLGAGQGQGSGQAVPERPKFNSKNISGIFYYDIDDTVEYVKIKDEDKDRAIAKVLKAHNKKVKKIEFLNNENFKEIDLLMNLAFSGTVKPGEKPKQAEGKDYLKKVMPSVRKELYEEEKKLNKEVESIVSAKQYKKWIKYQKQQKKELLPKRPSTGVSKDNDPVSRRFGSQQRGGFR